jgi:hypothetical protein
MTSLDEEMSRIRDGRMVPVSAHSLWLLAQSITQDFAMSRLRTDPESQSIGRNLISKLKGLSVESQYNQASLANYE